MSDTQVQAPAVGCKYMLYHSRFGRATVLVYRTDTDWADCEVLSGTIRGIGRGAVWGPGDTKAVRIEHGVWTPLNSDSGKSQP